MLSLIRSFVRWLLDPSPDPRRVSSSWLASHGYGWRPDGRK